MAGDCQHPAGLRLRVLGSDRQFAPIQIDVPPRQAEQLAAPTAGLERRREEPVQVRAGVRLQPPLPLRVLTSLQRADVRSGAGGSRRCRTSLTLPQSIYAAVLLAKGVLSRSVVAQRLVILHAIAKPICGHPSAALLDPQKLPDSDLQ